MSSEDGWQVLYVNAVGRVAPVARVRRQPLTRGAAMTTAGGGMQLGAA